MISRLADSHDAQQPETPSQVRVSSVPTSGFSELNGSGLSGPPPPPNTGDILHLLGRLADTDDPHQLAREGLRYLHLHLAFQAAAYLPAHGAGQLEPDPPFWTGTLPPGQICAIRRTCLTLTAARQPLNLSAHNPQLPAPLTRLICSPVNSHAQPVGLLVLLDTRPTPPLFPEAATLLDVLAQLIARATRQQGMQDSLNRTREQTFSVLGRLLEHRSHETKGHTERVTALALRFGLHLGLMSEQLLHLRWGAYLHDIGKIAVPDAVLDKEGPLSSLERHDMHRHVTIGEAILREQDLVPPAVLSIVRHHHERWDGQGYPDRLAAADIPLLARIFAVVDVYDALTSERPYKPSWSQDDTLSELHLMAGSHLDPHLVHAFQNMLSGVSQARPLLTALSSESAQAPELAE